MKWVDGKVRAVHREVFYAYNGYYPEVVRHFCDNPPCYNPRHLGGGTHVDNMADMKEKGRARGAAGESNGSAVLSEDQVRLIHRLSMCGKSNTELAERFGVSARTILRIISGKTWKHLLITANNT